MVGLKIMKRAGILLTLALGLLLSLTLFGMEKPNLIIISVDTLRQDHLGIYGYSRNTSPNIDKLLKKGAWFTEAHCNIPLTNPGFSSMMTSKYAHETGAVRNGIPMLTEPKTLAEILKANGYTTCAILSNWPLKAHLSNLNQGFDLYDDDFSKKRWLFFNDERDAQGVSQNAINWLESNPKPPFFLWVHFSDPHAPYLCHRGFSFYDPKNPKTEAQKRIDAYDSEIAYADHYIGILLEKIQELKLDKNSLMVFLADHGEHLGEHSYVGHGRYVHEPSLRIPFGLSGPGIPVNHKVSAQVELLDLAPTMLSYANITPEPDMRGRNLLPYLKGEKPWPQQYLIFYETYAGAVRIEELGKIREQTKPLWVGLKLDDLKVSYSLSNSRWEMFYLESDPGELKNLSDPKDPIFIQNSELLLEWYRSFKEKAVLGKTDQLTQEDKKKMKALGYLK